MKRLPDREPPCFIFNFHVPVEVCAEYEALTLYLFRYIVEQIAFNC